MVSVSCETWINLQKDFTFFQDTNYEQFCKTEQKQKQKTEGWKV